MGLTTFSSSFLFKLNIEEFYEAPLLKSELLCQAGLGVISCDNTAVLHAGCLHISTSAQMILANKAQ